MGATSDPDAALVGRDGELETLGRHLAAAAAGSGRTVLVSGEPGIGKTRLAAEVAHRARGHGLRPVWGRCRETEGAPPFLPWAQVVRGIGAGADPGLRPLLDPRAQAARGADRFQLFDGVTRFLVEQARREPLLLVLDDLHRADRSSLHLLDVVVHALDDAPVLLVGTFRDTEVGPGHPLHATLGEGAVAWLPLPALTVDDAARLAADLAPGGAVLPPAELHRRSGGNPFFLTELLRHRPAHGEAVPATVSAAISARVGRLPEDTRRLLTVAAVLGREFRPPLLAALAEVAVERVDDLLGPAVAAGLVRRPVDGDVHSFAHVLVREAVYEAVPPSRRATWHGRVVGIAEASGPEDEPDPGPGDPGPSDPGPSDPGPSDLSPSDLASHAVRAVRTPQERRRALRLATRAGAAARDRLAHDEAAAWFGRALELGVDTGDERYGLLMELGRCAGRASQVERARGAFDQARALAADEPRRCAAVALALGEVIDSAGGVDAGLVRMLEEALDHADDRATRIALTARLAVEIYWGPRLDEARQLAADAVAAARRLDDDRTLAVALAAQQFALRGPEHLDERLELGEELVGRSRSLHDEPMEIQARRLLLADRLQTEPGLADTELRALDALARRTRRPLARWYVMINECLRAGLGGTPEEALALVDATEAFGRRIGAAPARMYGVTQRFVLRRECGRGAESEDELRAVALAYPRLVTQRCALAVLLAEDGRDAEAGALVGELTRDGCAAVPRDALWASSVALLTVAAHRLGSADDAATLHRLLLPHSGGIVLQGLVAWWGAVDHYLGLAASTLGRRDDAERSFRAALALHGAWAATLFVRASLQGVESVRGGVAAPALTGREEEVLRLLAEGAANKQIARRLRISVHTVERHVANVYTKIGVNNRAAATAFVLRP
ncbi:ATP-binding protein [Pseudonocardia saturnea]